MVRTGLAAVTKPERHTEDKLFLCEVALPLSGPRKDRTSAELEHSAVAEDWATETASRKKYVATAMETRTWL